MLRCPLRARRLREVNLQLAAYGLPVAPLPGDSPGGGNDAAGGVSGLLESYREKTRLLSSHRCPADRRIEAFLQRHLADLNLPGPCACRTTRWCSTGTASPASCRCRPTATSSATTLLSSYRVRNGVLHNPRSDRRTTQGTFHVAEGGLPVPGDKKAVPKRVFAELFRHAMSPPAELHGAAVHRRAARAGADVRLAAAAPDRLPGGARRLPGEDRWRSGSSPRAAWSATSISSSPSSATPATRSCPTTTPASTSSTGPATPAASSSRRTWSRSPRSSSACRTSTTPPTASAATACAGRTRSEKYNDGSAFKLTCRTSAGVIVTLIADNYYGYCKKEVKTQISYAANLYGNVEEEHAGGAIAFASYSFGDEYQTDSRKVNGRTFADVVRDYGA